MSHSREKLGTKTCPRCGGRGTVPDETVGPSLKAFREKSGVALLKLSKELELSRTFLSDLEAGRRNWSPLLIEKYRRKVGELAA